MLPGSSGMEKLNSLRRAMARVHATSPDTSETTKKETAALLDKDTLSADSGERDEDILMPAAVGIRQTKDRWDIDTILSAYIEST